MSVGWLVVLLALHCLIRVRWLLVISHRWSLGSIKLSFYSALNLMIIWVLLHNIESTYLGACVLPFNGRSRMCCSIVLHKGHCVTFTNKGFPRAQ